jgi:hypothetical protein
LKIWNKAKEEAEEFIKFNPVKSKQRKCGKNSIDLERSEQNSLANESEESEEENDEIENLTSRANSQLRHSASQNKSIDITNKKSIDATHRPSNISRMSATTNFDDMNPLDKLEYWENQPDEIEVAFLDVGMPFGEIALLENQPRLATIKCKSDWVFATMDREDFQKTLKKIETRNTNRIIEFFKNLPYFSTYSRKALGRLRLNFRYLKYKRNQVVFREGDPSDYVYIVVKGDFELEK